MHPVTAARGTFARKSSRSALPPVSVATAVVGFRVAVVGGRQPPARPTDGLYPFAHPDGRPRRDQPEANRQRRAVWPLHRYRDFPLLREKEPYRDHDSQFAQVSISHFVTHDREKRMGWCRDYRHRGGPGAIRGRGVVGRLGEESRRRSPTRRASVEDNPSPGRVVDAPEKISESDGRGCRPPVREPAPSLASYPAARGRRAVSADRTTLTQIRFLRGGSGPKVREK